MRSAVKTRLSLAQRQPENADMNLAADDRRTERFNHTSVIVLNIENIIRLFFCLLEAAFKIHLAQKSEVRPLLNGHDASDLTSTSGMGNFDSDEGQNLFLIYTKGPDY